MKKLWVTYAWKDNEELDVDFILQELRGARLDVRFDRRQVITGQPLWPQIDQQITNADNSDAWAFIVSKHSLESAACREELNYALDRALKERGANFPIIGIFVGEIENELIPSAIRTRLYVNIENQDWLQRVRAGVEGAVPDFVPPKISPEFIKVHEDTGRYPLVVEARPRTGIWNPLVAIVPLAEKDSLHAVIVRPARKVPSLERFRFVEGVWPNDGSFWVRGPDRADCATPSMSMYVFLTSKPTRLLVGPEASPIEVPLSR